jgi:hypothetical protein
LKKFVRNQRRVGKMSAKVNIVSIEVKDNPGRFTDEVKLEITFECFDNLQDGRSDDIFPVNLFTSGYAQIWNGS